MKYKNIYILACFILILQACFEDKSNTDFNIINPIEIDLGKTPTSVKLFQFDSLIINPIIYKNGVNDKNLTYSWRIQGNEYPVTEIATTMALNYKVELPPNSRAYSFVLKVQDKTTNILVEKVINVTVNSNYGQGLLVADTKDEIRSDFGLITSMNFTSGIREEGTNIKHDIWTLRNNHKINGLVKNFQSLVKTDSRTLTVLTDKNILRVDPYDFGESEFDNDIFFVPIDNIKPDYIMKNNYMGYEFLINDGKMYVRNSSWANMYFNYHVFTKDLSDYRIGKMTNTGKGYYATPPYIYDELNNRLLLSSSRYDYLSGFSEQNASLPFDVNNFGAFDCLSMTEGESENIVMVMKSENADTYYVYVIQTQIDDNGNNLPAAKVNISNCTDIKNAVAFASSPLSNDFYYATNNKIYHLNLTGDEAVADERYTVNEGETITSMMLWNEEYGNIKVSDDSNPTGFATQSAQGRMLVITTYNESTKEGKVITLPIINIGSGTIDSNKKTHMEYGGFGRILCVRFHQIGY